jgi:glycosyltransferase involved in cell wall biosynthesis
MTVADNLTMSVVVATRDRAARLVRLLNALQNQTRPPTQVVVVDDGSTDRTPEVLTEWAGAWSVLIVVRQEQPRGPASARNHGIALAEGDVIVFTDDDCCPRPDWLAKLAEAVLEGADVVMGRTVVDDVAYAARGPWSHTMVTTGLDPMFSTCNIAYRTELLRALGGFDDGFRATRGGAEWGEDSDLGWRAVARGADVAFARSALVEHDVIDRTWRQYCLAGLRRQGIPLFVKKHPAYRRTLSLRALVNPAHGWAPLGAAGIVAGAVLLHRSTMLATGTAVGSFLPWVHFRLRVWPVHARRRALPSVLPRLWLADLLETGAVVIAAGRNRVFIV